MNRSNRRSNEQAAILQETKWTQITRRNPVNSTRKYRYYPKRPPTIFDRIEGFISYTPYINAGYLKGFKNGNGLWVFDQIYIPSPHYHSTWIGQRLGVACAAVDNWRVSRSKVLCILPSTNRKSALPGSEACGSLKIANKASGMNSLPLGQQAKKAQELIGNQFAILLHVGWDGSGLTT